ncbi:MAG TPA: gamma-glutamyl-gamma-aminobutyrate hydrolase family protein [Chroococcales cyanobacterium]
MAISRKAVSLAVLSTAISVSAYLPPLSAAEARASSKEVLPLIGINTDVEGTNPKEAKIYSLYYEAIEKSGGIPVLLPPLSEEKTKAALHRLDGIMLIGGPDYPPSIYGQEKNPKTHLMHEDRSKFDMVLASEAIATADMPVLGICAGSQVLNIASKGSLIQDIPTQKPESKIKHSSPNGWEVGFARHPIAIDRDSKLYKIYGSTPPSVVSSHHQCIDKVGSGFKVVAHSEDGVPEAIESTDGRFLIGVQYHPERDYEGNKILFDAFVSSCKHRAQDREAAVNAGSHADNSGKVTATTK